MGSRPAARGWCFKNSAFESPSRNKSGSVCGLPCSAPYGFFHLVLTPEHAENHLREDLGKHRFLGHTCAIWLVFFFLILYLYIVQLWEVWVHGGGQRAVSRFWRLKSGHQAWQQALSSLCHLTSPRISISCKFSGDSEAASRGPYLEQFPHLHRHSQSLEHEKGREHAGVPRTKPKV